MITISKKVCLLGDFAVGKTSLVRRFVYDLFDDKYISTIGVKVSRKTLVVPGEGDMIELTMMLWDLAGSESFTRMRANYLRGAAGALLVSDVSRPDTLARARQYLSDLRDINGQCVAVLAANKADLLTELPPDAGAACVAEARAMASRIGVALHLTSACDGREVEAAFRHLGSLLTS